MYRQYPQYYYTSLVPGTTAGTTSPGMLGFPGGVQTPIFYGASVPPAAAAQAPILPIREEITLEDVLQGVQLEAAAIMSRRKEYTQGYLRTLIGKLLKVEFLIGENMYVDRIGVLLEVGIDYIILREINTDDDLLCEAFSIKYVMEYK